MESIYYIPLKVMEKTKEFLVEQGKKDSEGYALWKGIKKTSFEYEITGIIIPEQKAIKTPFGYAFDIPPRAITDVNKVLFKSNEIGLIQVHSHPGKLAYHSDRDDKLSLLNRKGALSIVLPYFGNVNFTDFSQSVVHIHTGIHEWTVLTYSQVKKITKILR